MPSSSSVAATGGASKSSTLLIPTKMQQDHRFQTSEELNHWLSSWPTCKAQLKLIKEGLRRRQLQGAHTCAKATIEVLRTMVGMCKFHSTYHLMNIVRAVGRDLQAVAPSELTIGNIARRVLFMVREEYGHTKSAIAIASSTSGIKSSTTGTTGVSITDMPPPIPLSRNNSSSGGLSMSMPPSPVSTDLLSRRLQSLSMPTLERSYSTGSGDNTTPHSTSQESVIVLEEGESEEDQYSGSFTDIKQAVMGAILELNDEMDNLYGPICEQAQEYIHNDECVLVYGYSPILELFLKAAARKRRFQGTTCGLDLPHTPPFPVPPPLSFPLHTSVPFPTLYYLLPPPLFPPTLPPFPSHFILLFPSLLLPLILSPTPSYLYFLLSAVASYCSNKCSRLA